MGKQRPQKKKGIDPKSDKIPRKLNDPISYEEAHFSWCVHDNYIDYDEPKLGWRKVKITECLKVIIPALQSYEGLEWREVRLKVHCHPWGLDEIPARFYNRLIERRIDVDGLFQISLGSTRRVFGHKDGSFFYLIWYDPDHKYWSTKAK